MAPPPAQCDAFVATTGSTDPRSKSAHPMDKGHLDCTQKLSESSFGFCSCSDNIPRFVSGNKSGQTCNAICTDEPGVPIKSDLPGIIGISDKKKTQHLIDRMDKIVNLTTALGFVMVGTALIIFHISYSKQLLVGEGALRQLVDVTGVQATAHPVTGTATAKNVHTFEQDYFKKFGAK